MHQNNSRFDATGSALTTFNKGSDNLQPKVIALRSMQYTSGEMLYNPAAYADFKSKVKIRDEVRSNLKFCQLLCLLPIAVYNCLNTIYAVETHITQVIQKFESSMASLRGDRQCPPGLRCASGASWSVLLLTDICGACMYTTCCIAHFVLVVVVLSTVWILHDLLQVSMALSSANKWGCMRIGSMQS